MDFENKGNVYNGMDENAAAGETEYSSIAADEAETGTEAAAKTVNENKTDEDFEIEIPTDDNEKTDTDGAADAPADEGQAQPQSQTAYSYARGNTYGAQNGAYSTDRVQPQTAAKTEAPPYTGNSPYTGYTGSGGYTPPVIPVRAPKKKSGALKVVLSALGFGIIVSAMVAGTMFGMNKFLHGGKNAVSTSGVVGGNIELNGDVSDTDLSAIADAAMPSIVSITNKSVSNAMTFFGRVYEQEQVGAGSGIIYGQNETELLILSNYHVVADSKELKVYFGDVDVSEVAEDGEKSLDDIESYDATLKGSDPDLDLAVIAVKLESLPDSVKEGIVFATPGDSSTMKAGQRVVAIGNALGYGKSVTTGIISATQRKVTMQNSEGVNVTNSYIQTDAAINPGNSGGALLNMNGELIGINSAKIAANGVEGMGYAIPISDVADIIGELLVTETREQVAEEERGALGIMGQSVSQEISSAYGIPVGVHVKEVNKDSAAEKAGIKEGYIITKLEKTKVRTIEELQKQLTYYKAGETVKVTVQVRGEDGYSEKELSVTLDPKASLENENDQDSQNE